MVNKELIIDKRPNEIAIALLEDKKLVELHADKQNNNFKVGDIYCGSIKKMNGGMNAVFIDIGHDKDAFLQYYDLGPQIRSWQKFTKLVKTGIYNSETMNNFTLESDIDKNGKIGSVLKQNQEAFLQITKEPISNKGPRASTEIVFAGRYMVLIPFINKISISQKIKSKEERNRLKRLVKSIKPKNFGIIIRTNAEGMKVADLMNDLTSLQEKWGALVKSIEKSKIPELLLSEADKKNTLIRDIINDNLSQIYTNDAMIYSEIKRYINDNTPLKSDILKLYKGTVPIFEQYGVDKQIKSSFGKKITIKNGSYLIIEHTEAMHVIDVNSGPRTKSKATQEEQAIEVNLVSAKEIALQLRLRDMGGIIVVDFIDMHEKLNRRKLYMELSAYMKDDIAKHTILPPSKFGLVQITRQRVRSEMNIETLEKCPVCAGTGKVKASIILIDEIEENINYLCNEQNEKELTLICHPFVYSHITKGFRKSIKREWNKKYGKLIRFKEDHSYHMLEYHIFNKSNDEINL